MRRAFSAHFSSKNPQKQADRHFKKAYNLYKTDISNATFLLEVLAWRKRGVKNCDKALNFQSNSQKTNISLFSKYDTAFSYNKQHIIILTIVTVIYLDDFFTFKTIFHIKMTIAFNYL
ncbi:hypothetical protein [Photobacterium pectinilyticum]|uniref:hypothetical protein n=1 Tax=Photobacterium pectinilyticum TaxID=2906793 RepID=UPI0020CBA64D|nr:hypothetical protein [Photobacterium sp. ZSDE20]